MTSIFHRLVLRSPRSSQSVGYSKLHFGSCHRPGSIKMSELGGDEHLPKSNHDHLSFRQSSGCESSRGGGSCQDSGTEESPSEAGSGIGRES